MKKYNHPLDDFFREALSDHQMTPSDEARKAFLKDVMTDTRSEKNGRKGLIFLSVLLLLVSAGIFTWYITSDDFSSIPGRSMDPSAENSLALNQKINPVNQNTTNDQGTQQRNAVTKTAQISKKLDYQPSAQPSTRSPMHRAQEHTYNPPPPDPSNLMLPGQTDETGHRVALSSLAATPDIAGGDENVSASPNGRHDAGDLPEAGIIQSVALMDQLRPDTGTTQGKVKKDSVMVPASPANKASANAHREKSNWIPSMGVYYTPEWMFNTLEGTKFANNFGVEGTFHFGRFSVRTGAGLSIAKGTNELVVAYNDFLGAYNKLDSMEFTWNGPTQQYVPKFFMSNQDVWDSLMKLEYPRVVKRYTYLQIPLIMGYDFWQSDRMSICVRAGPVLSVLLASKQLSAEYDPGTKRIISINDIAPEQVSLNWQVMAGLNGAVHLTEALGIEIEPCVRYYFNSVYEKPVNNTKPWSIGLRVALVVKL